MEIIKGNLIDLAIVGEAKIIVHGCNCFHAMGSGIAGDLAKKFPEIPAADISYKEKGNPTKLARFSRAHVTKYYAAVGVPVLSALDNPFTCINLYTQYNPGADFIPSLFPVGLRKLNREFKGETLWFPRIGAGIAKGDWMYIEDCLLNNLPDVNVKVVVL